MKRLFLQIVIVALCLLFVPLIFIANTAVQEKQNDKFVAALMGDCYLCDTASVTEASPYWGEDNIGIINLNTFEMLRLEINRYDDQRTRIEDVAGYMQSSHLSGEDSQVHAYTFPDERYASVQISGVQYKIDRASIESNLCQHCIDTIFSLDFVDTVPAEYAIINFSTRLICPLTPRYTILSISNFEIISDYSKAGTINLRITYCPVNTN